MGAFFDFKLNLAIFANRLGFVSAPSSDHRVLLILIECLKSSIQLVFIIKSKHEIWNFFGTKYVFGFLCPSSALQCPRLCAQTARPRGKINGFHLFTVSTFSQLKVWPHSYSIAVAQVNVRFLNRQIPPPQPLAATAFGTRFRPGFFFPPSIFFVFSCIIYFLRFYFLTIYLLPLETKNFEPSQNPPRPDDMISFSLALISKKNCRNFRGSRSPEPCQRFSCIVCGIRSRLPPPHMPHHPRQTFNNLLWYSKGSPATSYLGKEKEADPRPATKPGDPTLNIFSLASGVIFPLPAPPFHNCIHMSLFCWSFHKDSDFKSSGFNTIISAWWLARIISFHDDSWPTIDPKKNDWTHFSQIFAPIPDTPLGCLRKFTTQLHTNFSVKRGVFFAVVC